MLFQTFVAASFVSSCLFLGFFPSVEYSGGNGILHWVKVQWLTWPVWDFPLLPLTKSFVVLAVCFGSLSCCIMKLLPMSLNAFFCKRPVRIYTEKQILSFSKLFHHFGRGQSWSHQSKPFVADHCTSLQNPVWPSDSFCRWVVCILWYGFRSSSLGVSLEQWIVIPSPCPVEVGSDDSGVREETLETSWKSWNSELESHIHLLIWNSSVFGI